MKVAFDFDGTISSHPRKMNELAVALHEVGHEIVVLTAGAGELPAPQRPAEMAKRIKQYGFHVPHLLACVEGWQKGEWCRLHSVDVVLDDSSEYLSLIAKESPSTMRLQVFS